MTFSYCECGRSSAVAILVLCPLPAHIPGDPGSIPGYAKVFLASAPKAFHSSCCEYQPTMYSLSSCCEYQPTIYSHSLCCEYQPTIYSHSSCCVYQPTMYSQSYNTTTTNPRGDHHYVCLRTVPRFVWYQILRFNLNWTLCRSPGPVGELEKTDCEMLGDIAINL